MEPGACSTMAWHGKVGIGMVMDRYRLLGIVVGCTVGIASQDSHGGSQCSVSSVPQGTSR